MPVSEPIQPDEESNPEFAARLRADGSDLMREVPDRVHERIVNAVGARGRPAEGRPVVPIWTFRRLVVAAVLLIGIGAAAWMLSRPATPSSNPEQPQIAHENQQREDVAQPTEVASHQISPLRQLLDDAIAELNLEERLEKRALDKAREILDRGDLLIRGMIARVPPSMQGSLGEGRGQ